MSEIRFEDQSDEFGQPRERAAGFDMAGKLVAWGVASDRQQAEYILMGVAACAILIGILFWWLSLPPAPKPLDPRILVPGPDGGAASLQ